MKGFTQVSRTAAAKVDEDVFDPLSAFAQEQPNTTPTNSNRLSMTLGSPENNIGGFQIKDDADQRDKTEFVTVEKLKIVSSVRKEPAPPQAAEPEYSPKDSKMRLGSVSPVRGGNGGLEESRMRMPNVGLPSLSQVSSFLKKSTEDNTSPTPMPMPVPSSRNVPVDPSSVSATDIDNFPFLSGEMKVMSMINSAVHVIPIGGISGVLYMTNYRIAFLPSEEDMKLLKRTSVSLQSWLHVPLATIDKLEREKRPKDTPNAGITILIVCKDCRQLRINIKSNSPSNGDYDLERAFSLINTYAFPNNLRYLFAFNHSMGRREIGDLRREYERMGVTTSNLWRISSINNSFRLCATYPEELVFPSSISDDEIAVVAGFRSGHRLPVLCWANPRFPGTLWRSSQPKAGVSGSCQQDIRLLETIGRSYASNLNPHRHRHSAGNSGEGSILYIVDARSRNSAMANMAAGAGYETQTNYPSCRLDFYNIPNIHAVRDSYKSMCSLVLNPTANPSSDITFSKQVEDTQWLTNVRLILKASFETAAFLNKGFPILVHCSHGWDRTAQITCLAQLFLDPFYRTFDGFPVLIEKEWLSFGHQFTMRCAHGQDKTSRQDGEFSPIFLQFLDCLWQVLRQFNQHFEFNTKYVLTVADHVYSGRFGTFLFSSEVDRMASKARTHSADLWQYLHCNRASLTNPFYTPTKEVFLPPLGQLLRGVGLWSDYFLRWSSVVSLPNLNTDLHAYHEQLRLLEQQIAPATPLRAVDTPSNNDTALYENSTNAAFLEAMWARERLHRLRAERELQTAAARHQRALEKVLSIVRDQASPELLRDLQDEIRRLEDEELQTVQNTLAANHQDDQLPIAVVTTETEDLVHGDDNGMTSFSETEGLDSSTSQSNSQSTQLLYQPPPSRPSSDCIAVLLDTSVNSMATSSNSPLAPSSSTNVQGSDGDGYLDEAERSVEGSEEMEAFFV